MMNGMNMQQMMKQAKKLQKQMMKEQQSLAEQEFVGQAPDEMVKATFNGSRELVDLQIKPEAVDPDDVEMLSDLVVAAVNDGLKKVAAATEKSMGKYTTGLGM